MIGDAVGSRYGLNHSHSFSGSPTAMSIDKLFPALLECFGIILCGYVAGRANIITSTQAKGLGNFVSKFALPALLFKNMVLLDFGNVVWSFLWSILIAKVSVFIIVCVLTLVVAGPESRFSKAGLYSIFATQSNDFALGYPIVEALYKNTYPEYLQYIYLVAPVSLMILNPIGFAFCEIQKWRNSQDQQHNKLRIVGVVILQVLKNPIVFMVVVGLVSHFLLGHKIPVVMQEFVDGLANSFGGAALFYLGLSMVGQLRKFTKSTVVALILLITAKLLVMPLICRDMVELLDSNSSSPQNHTSLSNYAFLYGVFPTAPSVAIYASQYNMELEVFLVCIGMILWNFIVKQDNFIGQVLTFTLLYGSLYSTYVWTGLISLSLVLMKKNNEMTVPPGIFPILGWGVPALTMGILLIVAESVPGTIDSAFFYGRTQIISTAVVQSCSILLGGCSLMGLSRGTQDLSYQVLERGSTSGTTEDLQPENNLEDQTVLQSGTRGGCINGGTRHCLCLHVIVYVLSECQMCECAQPQPMPDMIVSTHVNDTSCLQPGECTAPCESPHCLLVQEEERLQQAADRQVARHTLLCLLLTVSLLANLSSCLWWLFNRDPGSLYLELQFFCAIANYGQGFISFGIFGLDKHLIIIPFKKRLASLWQGRERVEEPQAALPEEIRLTCTQFIRYHKDQCVQDIVQKRRCGERTVVGTFLGSELVEWLLRAGVARDRGEGLLYGTQLEQGGVLQHVAREVGFQDDSLHYRFTEGGRLAR
ncbi:integral membrane protein GPR155-like [Scleropages formosus]|uniref:Integral membrane protein GPR155-like n=1 Tax=Scleropages formosus TaxID=113540 RepID=A0A0P7V6D8_SCLFO|nr:integral membrane protein GPR155-like [Scleropages formosus]